MSTDIVQHTGHPTDVVVAAPSPLEWQALKEQAGVIVASGLAPKAVNTPEKVLTIALKGRELRVPPMQALSHVHIIEGKPALSAELMTALVRRAGHKIRVTEASDTKCVVVGVRADDPDYPLTVTWTMETAKQAGVAEKGTWKQYPAAMLLARATSALCRAMFSDVLMGASYTPEELGAEVDPETGEVIDVQVEDAYRDPRHTDLLGQVDAALERAAELGVAGNADAARDYARKGVEHAEATLRKVTAAIDAAAGDGEASADGAEADPDADGEVVDAEVVDECARCGVEIAGEHDCQPAEPEPEACDVCGTPGCDVDHEAPKATGVTDPDAAVAAVAAYGEQLKSLREGQPYDWRAHASSAGLGVTNVLVPIQQGWPANDMGARPKNSADIDRKVAEDPVFADEVRVLIDDLAKAKEQQDG